jgi:hypothetical protein
MSPRERDILPRLAATVVAAITAAPGVLGFAGSHAAVAGHIAFAMAVGPIALLLGALRVAAATTSAAGAWLAASPWALGYASLGAGAWSADLLAGLLLLALGARAVRAGAGDTPVPPAP